MFKKKTLSLEILRRRNQLGPYSQSRFQGPLKKNFQQKQLCII